jgi:hypothetical protein
MTRGAPWRPPTASLSRERLRRPVRGRRAHSRNSSLRRRVVWARVSSRSRSRAGRARIPRFRTLARRCRRSRAGLRRAASRCASHPGAQFETVVAVPSGARSRARVALVPRSARPHGARRRPRAGQRCADGRRFSSPAAFRLPLLSARRRPHRRRGRRVHSYKSSRSSVGRACASGGGIEEARPAKVNEFSATPIRAVPGGAMHATLSVPGARLLAASLGASGFAGRPRPSRLLARFESDRVRRFKPSVAGVRAPSRSRSRASRVQIPHSGRKRGVRDLRETGLLLPATPVPV